MRFTLEASSNSIGLGHDNLSHVSAVEFGIGHESSCEGLAFQVGLFVGVIAEAQVKWLVIHAIRLPYRVPNKRALASVWLR